MCGAKIETNGLFSYVSPNQRVPQGHPLRAIRAFVDRSLAEMDTHFSMMYSTYGRPSIPPEFLLRALLLQVFYSIRSEGQLIEQLHYNLLFRWFVGLGMDEEVWVPTVFSKNRDRLLDHDTAQEFFRSVLQQARRHELLSEEHFSVDGTLLETWASQKSFRPKDPEDQEANGLDFCGVTRSNGMHTSVTDSDGRSYKKALGEATLLADISHVLIDCRFGLIALWSKATTAYGTAEVDAVTQLIDEVSGTSSITLGADKGHDHYEIIGGLCERNSRDMPRESARLLRWIDVRPGMPVMHNEHSHTPTDGVDLWLGDGGGRNTHAFTEAHIL